jgi:hypothetical protein
VLPSGGGRQTIYVNMQQQQNNHKQYIFYFFFRSFAMYEKQQRHAETAEVTQIVENDKVTLDTVVK